MAKYKSLIVTTLLSVAALTGAVTTGVVRNRSMASSFEGDGYIVNVAETEEGLTAEPVYFSAGTKYKKTYPMKQYSKTSVEPNIQSIRTVLSIIRTDP